MGRFEHGAGVRDAEQCRPQHQQRQPYVSKNSQNEDSADANRDSQNACAEDADFVDKVPYAQFASGDANGAYGYDRGGHRGREALVNNVGGDVVHERGR